LSPCGAGALAREDDTKHQIPCSADTPVREAEANAAVQREAPAKPLASQQNVSQLSPTAEPEERKNHRDPPPNHENPPSAHESKERELIKRAEAAIEGATRRNWRDLRTVFEFAGISERSKEAPS
jgi:hypothetical protein